MNELNFTEIYPKIYVYKNLFKNTQDIIDILNDVDENSFLGQWEDWYTFGKEIDTININSQETEKTKKELLKQIKERKLLENSRYIKYYNLNYHDKKNYDLIIDTSKMDVEGIIKKIIDFVKKNN